MAKSNKSSFGGDIIFKTLSELITAVLGIVTFSIFSQQLIKSDYAVVNQFISIGALVAPIILVKMNNAFCVFLANETDQTKLKSRYLTTCIITIAVSIAIIILMILCSDYLAVLMFDDTKFAFVIPYMAIYYVFLSFSTLSQDFYRAIRKIKKTSIIIILKTILTTIAFVLLVLYSNLFVIKNVLIIYTLIELIIAIYCFAGVMKSFGKTETVIEFEPLKEYYKYSLPLMPYLVMSWINSFVGRFILTHLMNLENSGVYSFNSSLITRLFFLNVVIGYTVFPYIAKYWNEGRKDLVEEYLLKGYKLGISFALPITFGIVVTAPTVIQLLSGGNYDTDRLLLFILCVGSIFQLLYNIYAYLIDLSRKTMMYNIIFLITSILNVALNFMLIPIFNIYGAGLALLITYIVQFILTCFIGSKAANLKLHFDIVYLLKCLGASLLMTGATLLIYRDSGILNFGITVIVGIIVYAIVILILDKEIRLMAKEIVESKLKKNNS